VQIDAAASVLIVGAKLVVVVDLPGGSAEGRRAPVIESDVSPSSLGLRLSVMSRLAVSAMGARFTSGYSGLPVVLGRCYRHAVGSGGRAKRSRGWVRDVWGLDCGTACACVCLSGVCESGGVRRCGRSVCGPVVLECGYGRDCGGRSRPSY